MNITPLVWIITIAVTIAFFVYEFFAHVRKPHEPTIGESARWSAFYISLALLFGVGIGVVSGWTYGGEYFAGYLTEKALSIDNLFVFLIVMTSFAVPKIYQQKVLMIGIVIALILRGVFIAVGATLISNFSWIFYLFGALLLFLAYRQAFSHGESNPADGRFMRFVRRHLPVSDEYDGDRLTVKRDGRRFVTPMLLVIIAIGVVAKGDGGGGDSDSGAEASPWTVVALDEHLPPAVAAVAIPPPRAMRPITTPDPRRSERATASRRRCRFRRGDSRRVRASRGRRR